MSRRPLFSFLLSFCLVWQIAFASHGMVPSGGDAAEHAAMHLFDESHSHHDDGVQRDQSHEAVQHIQADRLTHLSAVLPTAPTAVPPCYWPSAWQFSIEQALSPPFLAGPERPPRTLG